MFFAYTLYCPFYSGTLNINIVFLYNKGILRSYTQFTARYEAMNINFIQSKIWQQMFEAWSVIGKADIRAT